MKRLFLLGFALTLAVCMPMAAFADTGVWGEGGLTETLPAYGIDADAPLIAYNSLADDDPDWEDIKPGTAIYLPVKAVTTDENGNEAWESATDKQIKSDAVKATYKATKGSQYINSVSIVDIGKEKLKGLPSDTKGMYIRVLLSESYSSTRSTNVMLKLVLSANRVSYQDTEVELGFDLVNRAVYIDRDSIYGAQVPTVFEADYYSGEATFDLGNGVTYTARVKDGAKYVINYTTDEVSSITALSDKAHMQFHRFLGEQDTFVSYGDLEIPIDSGDFADEEGNAKVYVYEIEGTRLTALGSDLASYKNGVLTIRARTLGEYVLSSEKLVRDVGEAEPSNVVQSGYASREEAAPPAPVTPTPVATGTNTINADNASGDNPVTGTKNLPSLMVLTAILAAAAALATWKRNPFGRTFTK